MYKKNVLDMIMNIFIRIFKVVWKFLKLRIKFVLVNILELIFDMF